MSAAHGTVYLPRAAVDRAGRRASAHWDVVADVSDSMRPLCQPATARIHVAVNV